MKQKEEIEYHEFANIFPLLHGEMFDELVEDVRKNGLLEPIILLDGKILDGRNRYRACMKSKVDPIYRIFNYNIDPLDYGISKNIKRRQLTPAQKAESVDKIIGLKNLRIEDNKIKNGGKDVQTIIKDLGVQENTIVQANTIKKIIDPKNMNTTITITPIKGKPRKIEITDERAKNTKKQWEKAKKGNGSVKGVYETATDTKKEKSIRVSYKDFYKNVKEKYTVLQLIYKKVKKICIERGIWDEIFKEAFPVVSSEKSFEPTVKELREAGLL